VCLRIGDEKDNKEKIKLRLAKLRLFGSEKEFSSKGKENYFLNEKIFPTKIREEYEEQANELINKDGFRKGRLIFYPTFFDKLAIEVFNPHDRNRRAGKIPFWVEAVPVGSAGLFQVLYFPFDLAHKEYSEIKEEIKDDLNVLLQAIHDTFRVYGFGAKHLSGFGRAENEFVTENVILQNNREPIQIKDFEEMLNKGKDSKEKGTEV